MLIATLGIISSNQAETQIVWSDDFNDGDLEGWRAEGYYAPLVGDWSYPPNGEMANIDNVLRIPGDLEFRNGSIIIHESNVSYGSWSFDLHIKSAMGSSNHTHVYFIDGRPYQDPHPFTSLCCYDIMVSSTQWSPKLGEVPDYAKEVYDLSPAYFLVKRPGVQVLAYFQEDNVDGWKHFEITRNDDGNFKVYINGTLRIEATDNSYRVSRSFWFTGESGTYAGLDNIVVTSSFGSTSSTTNSTETGESSSQSTMNDLETSKSDSDETGFSTLFGVYLVILMAVHSISRKHGQSLKNF
jgi:hypothetical protein